MNSSAGDNATRNTYPPVAQGGIAVRLLRLAEEAPAAPFAFLLLLLLAVHDSQNLWRPEFWAEDGAVWYPQAYTEGIASLARPFAGYFNTAQRLVALAAQALPLAWAPLAFNLAAYAVHAGVALYLVSPRMAEAWPRLGARRLFACLFMLMPAAHETLGNLTNVQWTLGLLAFLVLAGSPPFNRRQRLFDGAVLVLCAGSGPFCLFLLPLAAAQWWRSREPARAWQAALLTLAAGVQILSIAAAFDSRGVGPLGASLPLLLRIGALIPLEAGFGARFVSVMARQPLWQSPWFGAALGLAALAACTVAARRGPPLLRQFLLFSALTFAAALAKPLIRMGVPQWPVMAFEPPAGARYFLFPLLAWWGVLFACTTAAGAWRRASLTLLLSTALIAIPLDWTLWTPDRHDQFQAQARRFDAAAPGTRVAFAIRPRWFNPMVLVKK